MPMTPCRHEKGFKMIPTGYQCPDCGTYYNQFEYHIYQQGYKNGYKASEDDFQVHNELDKNIQNGTIKNKGR